MEARYNAGKICTFACLLTYLPCCRSAKIEQHASILFFDFAVLFGDAVSDYI